MKKFTMLTIFLFSLMMSTFATGAELSWQTNFAQASQQAQSSGKPIVMLFTGTDWCYWCKRLERDILQNPEFVNAVNDKFIFVFLDFPRGSPQNPTLSAQNEQLANKFNVNSFPTIIILDSKGQFLSKPTYDRENPRSLADQLLRLRQ